MKEIGTFYFKKNQKNTVSAHLDATHLCTHNIPALLQGASGYIKIILPAPCRIQVNKRQTFSMLAVKALLKGLFAQISILFCLPLTLPERLHTHTTYLTLVRVSYRAPHSSTRLLALNSRGGNFNLVQANCDRVGMVLSTQVHAQSNGRDCCRNDENVWFVFSSYYLAMLLLAQS